MISRMIPFMAEVIMTTAVLILTLVSSVANAEEPSFAVDFTKQIGPIKALNGTNLWSQMSVESFQDSHPIVKTARFSTVRLHDCPWDNNGQRLVDVHQIFGNLNADPSNPENYFFLPTDDYIKKIVESGSKVIYRLGTTIEHTTPHYFTGPPKDPKKYAEICAAIVRHYNKGWANGFHWNIQYWEIWNEPDLVPQMWQSRDFQTYCDFYVTVAKRLHKEFPDIKIGGPAITNANLEKLQMLAKSCKAAGVPLDFCTWHCYPSVPEQLLDTPQKVRDLLDQNGFANTELHLNEWHYFPAPWSEMHGTKGGPQRRIYWRNSPEGINGYDAAGFVGYVLSRWQDTPLTMSNYYATGLDNWGLISPDGEVRKPFYAFVAFADFLEKCPRRVKTTDKNHVALLGAVGSNGNKALLISSWKQNVENLQIALTGVPSEGTVQIKRVDLTNDLKEETVSYTNGLLKITNQPGSFVLLVQW